MLAKQNILLMLDKSLPLIHIHGSTPPRHGEKEKEMNEKNEMSWPPLAKKKTVNNSINSDSTQDRALKERDENANKIRPLVTVHRGGGHSGSAFSSKQHRKLMCKSTLISSNSSLWARFNL